MAAKKTTWPVKEAGVSTKASPICGYIGEVSIFAYLAENGFRFVAATCIIIAEKNEAVEKRGEGSNGDCQLEAVIAVVGCHAIRRRKVEVARGLVVDGG